MNLANTLSAMSLPEKIIFKLQNKIRPQKISALNERSAINFFRSQNKKYQKMINTILPFAERASVIADVGSNIGYFSLLLHKNLENKNKHFILFEPLKKLTTINKKILSESKLDNFSIMEYGLGSEDKELKIFTARDGNIGWNTMVNVDNAEQEMDCTRVQIKRFDGLNLPPPDFIKIDIEGYEYQALQGMMSFLKKNKPFMLIEIGFGKKHPNYTEVKKTFKELESIGYKLFDLQLNPLDFDEIESTQDVILKI